MKAPYYLKVFINSEKYYLHVLYTFLRVYVGIYRFLFNDVLHYYNIQILFKNEAKSMYMYMYFES